MNQSPSLTRPVVHTSPLALFRNRNYSVLWLTEFFSELAVALSHLGIAILVFKLTGSAFQVGLVLVMQSLPSLLIGLIAGVVADRYDHRRTMWLTRLLRGLILLGVPLTLSVGDLSNGTLWLYVALILTSGAAEFTEAAFAALLPEVVPAESLAPANAFMEVSTIGATVLGYAAAGFLVSALPASWLFVICAGLFGLSGVLTLALRTTHTGSATDLAEHESSFKAVLDNLASGVRYIPQMPALRSLVSVLVLSGIAVGLFNAILLPFAQRAVGANDIEYSLFESIQSIGFVGGALLMVLWADRLHEGQWLTISFAGLGASMLWLFVAPTVGAAYLPLFVLGLINAPNYVVRGLLVQRNVPRHLRGRIASIFSLQRHAMLLIGMLLAGLADYIDVRILMIVPAAGLILTGLLALILPGLGQPTAEWRRLLSMLRTASQAPRLGLGRAATLTDILNLIELSPALSGLTEKARQTLADQTRVYEAPAGTAILRKGEASDAAYFLLQGRAAASVAQGNGDPRVLEVLQQGDFFGEIAAINNVPRTADVIAEQPSRLLQLPAAVLHQLMADSTIHHVFTTKMNERLNRLSLMDLPYGPALNQQALRELRTPSVTPAK